ncbi:unnamed protein product [Cuscuta epithymum]|uniref:Uncharacterized protein n=1 Tax=Cuscuta epithymum TaxID=186058 RepID=A0AAV0CG00_9ASTE|nr:unnamed protein product [Cuscuta epithymum]
MAILLGHVSSPSVLLAPPSSAIWNIRRNLKTSFYPRAVGVKACFFNPIPDQPIIKEALKEPVAFMGGMLAGLLRIDLNEDPLKEWVTRTVEATQEIHQATETQAEDTPLQIEIE